MFSTYYLSQARSFVCSPGSQRVGFSRLRLDYSARKCYGASGRPFQSSSAKIQLGVMDGAFTSVPRSRDPHQQLYQEPHYVGQARGHLSSGICGDKLRDPAVAERTLRNLLILFPSQTPKATRLLAAKQEAPVSMLMFAQSSSPNAACDAKHAWRPWLGGPSSRSADNPRRTFLLGK